ncbi:hypothetical protein BDW59DRAFT_166818 [Aspergillus cavernicola]|uniref:Uncharacterized protein n=1 Tax=Aspergillus cavernicola TaxID=176166 RepID=A0ABR4HKY9_9EURO
MSNEMVPLIEQGSAPGYNVPFQVTIDAGAATSGMINFSVNALARISHAGIDHFAFGLCVLVGNTISCSAVGLERFYTAIKTAPVHAGFQKVLWFGFGHKSPLQILTGTDSGSKFAALSACLAEVYSANMAGSIMLEFTRKAMGQVSESQQTALPSQLQMTLLVEKCAGIFSASSFPLWAEQYMAFDREALVGQHAWRHGANRTRHTRGVASASDIANALHAIMDLRRGPTRHLTFIGVADSALVAAIGTWLLDLNVILYTSEQQRDEDVWFQNFADHEEPHLTVIYSRQAGGSALVQRDHTIQMPNATALFKSHAELQPSHDYVNMNMLLSRKPSFGSALGSAARIFSALKHADPDVPLMWLRACTTYFPASHGVDFVHFAQSRFPELASDACLAFQHSLSNLAGFCSCKTCCPTQRPGDNTISRQGHSSPWRCLVALTVAVIRLIRGLSGINPIDGLYPSRKGMECLQAPADASGAGHGISGSARNASPLRFAEYVFRGEPFADEPEKPGTSAISRDGICFYLDILKNPLSEDPMALCWVNVLPGHIQFEGRLYNRVGEKTTDLSNKGLLQKRPSVCVPPKVFSILERCAGGTVMLNVTDSATRDRRPTLEVFFGILQNDKHHDVVGPWRVVHNISRSLGLIKCRNDGCVESEMVRDDLAKAIQDTAAQAQTIKIGNSKVSLFEDNPVSRLLVTYNCWEPLIQREECLACSVGAGYQTSSPINSNINDGDLIHQFFEWKIINTRLAERQVKWEHAREVIVENKWSIKDLYKIEDYKSIMYDRAIQAKISDSLARRFREELQAFKLVYQWLRATDFIAA